MSQVFKDAKGVWKNEAKVSNKWKYYFEGLLNVNDDSEVELNSPEMGSIRTKKSRYEIIIWGKAMNKNRLDWIVVQVFTIGMGGFVCVYDCARVPDD